MIHSPRNLPRKVPPLFKTGDMEGGVVEQISAWKADDLEDDTDRLGSNNHV